MEGWVRDKESYRNLGYGKWAVLTKKDRAFIGYCGLTYVADVGGKAEVAVGYRLARSFWGQGYASEALRTTIAYGLSVLGRTRLVATIDPGNAASIRVAKAGMVYEKDVMPDGYTYPDPTLRD